MGSGSDVEVMVEMTVEVTVQVVMIGGWKGSL